MMLARSGCKGYKDGLQPETLADGSGCSFSLAWTTNAPSLAWLLNLKVISHTHAHTHAYTGASNRSLCFCILFKCDTQTPTQVPLTKLHVTAASTHTRAHTHT